MMFCDVKLQQEPYSFHPGFLDLTLLLPRCLPCSERPEEPWERPVGRGPRSSATSPG